MKKITDFPVVRDQIEREAADKAKQAAQAPTVYARALGVAGQRGAGQPASPEGASQ